MKVHLHRSPETSPTSFGITWALLGFAITGFALSISLTHDSRWLTWHMSRLGEGGQLSAAIFNFTMCFTAIIFTLVSTRISEEIYLIKPHLGARTLRNLFIAVAACWTGIASFPFDQFPLIHNIFGYGMAAILIITVLGLERICPRFSRRTYRFGKLAAIAVIVLLGLYLSFHALSLLIVELIGECLLFLWVLSMTDDLRHTRQKPLMTLYH